ncbi:DUF6538 domain-containing protein [uncultured Desulfuromonas sp.]|uniref:DUF6538 domain-containing protein n=1 Tax=uncultured Desulfuromonas sp. TaxID=181013 RepID=UPI00374DCBF5
MGHTSGDWVLSFHLTKRNQIYYFRIRILQDPTSDFPTKDVKKSLRTKDRAAAKLQCSHRETKFRLCRTMWTMQS